jgi:hypothetical protein
LIIEDVTTPLVVAPDAGAVRSGGVARRAERFC